MHPPLLPEAARRLSISLAVATLVLTPQPASANTLPGGFDLGDSLSNTGIARIFQTLMADVQEIVDVTGVIGNVMDGLNQVVSLDQLTSTLGDIADLGATINEALETLEGGLLGEVFGVFGDLTRTIDLSDLLGLDNIVSGIEGVLGIPDPQALDERIRSSDEDFSEGELTGASFGSILEHNELNFGNRLDTFQFAIRTGAVDVANNAALSQEAQTALDDFYKKSQLTTSRAIEGASVSEQLAESSSDIHGRVSLAPSQVSGLRSEIGALAADSQSQDVTQRIMANISEQMSVQADIAGVQIGQLSDLSAQLASQSMQNATTADQLARVAQIQQRIAEEAVEARVMSAHDLLLQEQVAREISSQGTRDRRREAAAGHEYSRQTAAIMLPGNRAALLDGPAGMHPDGESGLIVNPFHGPLPID